MATDQRKEPRTETSWTGPLMKPDGCPRLWAVQTQPRLQGTGDEELRIVSTRLQEVPLQGSPLSYLHLTLPPGTFIYS